MKPLLLGVCSSLMSIGFAFPAYSQQSVDQILSSADPSKYTKNQVAGYIYTVCSVMAAQGLSSSVRSSISDLPISIMGAGDAPPETKSYLEGFPDSCFTLLKDQNFVRLVRNLSGSTKSQDQMLRLTSFGIGANAAACAIRSWTRDESLVQSTNSTYVNAANNLLPVDQAAWVVRTLSSALESDSNCSL